MIPWELDPVQAFERSRQSGQPVLMYFRVDG